MSRQDREAWYYIGFGVLTVVFILSLLAAWGTHVITCLQDERWFFLIAGAIAAPIAIIHGFGIWFGAF